MLIIQQRKYFSREKKKEKRSIWGSVGVLLVGFALFFALLYVQKSALAGYKTECVVVAAKAINQNTKLTKAELQGAFEEVEINSRNIVEGSFQTIEELIAVCENGYAKIPIAKNAQMNLAYIKKQEDYEENMRKPVEVGCKVNASEFGLCGVIREGDLVDVSIVAPNETLTEDQQIFGLENVWVTKVFDNNGGVIEATDTTSVSVSFNLVMEDEVLEEFTKAMGKGKLYLSRKITPYEEEK